MKTCLIAATLIGASLGCVRPNWRTQQDFTIKMPRLDSTTGALVVDGPVLQALRIAADDFLPPTSRPRACADTQPAFKYFASQRGDIIFVRIEENPSYCGAKYHSLDSGARYAISTNGRILRRVLDGESADVETEGMTAPSGSETRDGGTDMIDVTVPPGASPPWPVGTDAGAAEQLPPVPLDGGIRADGGTAQLPSKP